MNKSFGGTKKKHSQKRQSLSSDMERTTLDKLVDKIKNFSFYRIAFNTYDERRVWIIGKKTSYLEEIVDDEGPKISYRDVCLNVMQTITIRSNDEDINDKNKVSVHIYPGLSSQVEEACQEEGSYFYRFESADYIDVIDFEGFKTPDKFFEDILKHLDNSLKDKYGISIGDLNSGQYFEIPLGEDQLQMTCYELSVYKPDMTGLRISSLMRVPLNDHGFIFFEKLNGIMEELRENFAASHSVVDPKNEISDLVKTVAGLTCKEDLSTSRIEKGCKWIKAKTK